MERGAVKNEWLRGLLDFVYPPLCLGCGTFTESPHAICSDCMKRLDRFDAPFCLNCLKTIPTGSRCDSCGADTILLYAFGNYTTPLQEIVIQYKFRGITHPAELFAEHLCAQFGENLRTLGCRLLVPVPLYPSREHYRGYNQAAILADELARRLDFEVHRDLLARVQRRKPQAKLDFRHRVRNIKDVFEVINLPDDGTRDLILVDDVVTTGSTVLEAKRTLEKAGFNVMAVVSIAHAL